MISLDDELLGLSDIAKACAVAGKKPHISTVYRWMTSGVRGVRLEHIRVGRHPVTTRKCIEEFTRKLAEMPSTQRQRGTEPKRRTSKQRDRDIAKAKATLARYGIGGETCQ